MVADQFIIEGWLKVAKREKGTHMIVVCDEWDHSDYAVIVGKELDVREVYERYNGKNMQRVMEVYSLKLPIADQMAEHRAMHF